MGVVVAILPPLFIRIYMYEGAKLISEAILGLDMRVVVVADKQYVIKSPTIKKLAGCARCLSELPKADTFADMLNAINNADKLAKALSWMINGDESLYEDLSKGTYKEIVDALEKAYSMIDMRDFMRAVGLQRSVAELTARPKQQETKPC